jgi:glycosyltransferase involved in cell wall biosynthesis
MRLTLVIHSLGAGGAERVMSNLASLWSERGRDVSLITIESKAADFYSLPRSVRRIALGLAGESRGFLQTLRHAFRRIIELRRAIRSHPTDAIISFTDNTNLLTLLAVAGLGIPVIVSERIHPGHHDIGWSRSRLRRVLYPRADAIVVQTNDALEWMRRFFRDVPLYRVPNPALPPPHDLGERAPSGGVRTVITMGRLVPQKQCPLLVRAFSQSARDRPDWMLTILGDGPERGRVVAEAQRLGIAARLRLPGFVRAPARVLREADLFVLSSRFEGFPNALLEAMACGLPAISFDCPSGPGEIIRDGVDGVLIPCGDVDALAQAMTRLMSNDTERARLGARAREVLQRFSAERILGLWDGVLNDVRVRVTDRR